MVLETPPKHHIKVHHPLLKLYFPAFFLYGNPTQREKKKNVIQTSTTQSISGDSQSNLKKNSLPNPPYHHYPTKFDMPQQTPSHPIPTHPHTALTHNPNNRHTKRPYTHTHTHTLSLSLSLSLSLHPLSTSLYLSLSNPVDPSSFSTHPSIHKTRTYITHEPPPQIMKKHTPFLSRSPFPPYESI